MLLLSVKYLKPINNITYNYVDRSNEVNISGPTATPHHRIRRNRGDFAYVVHGMGAAVLGGTGLGIFNKSITFLTNVIYCIMTALIRFLLTRR